MGQIGSLWYNIGAKTADLQKGLTDSKAGLTKLKNGFQSITGASLTAAAAFTAGGKAIQFVINEAMEAEKSEVRLATALKSTNYAAGLSKDALMAYATQMSKLTVNSEETIMDAQSLMLTFTKIGKETFPQAMEAAMNMSAAFGQDLQSSVIQLGKALNDPSGMAAMKRIGVSFSEAQISMAKAMFEAGDIAGYQKIIMGELNTEVGGMAKAMATTYSGQVAILKNNFGELGEEVGKRLIPWLSDAAKALNGLLTVQGYWEDMVRNAPVWMSKAGISYEDYKKRVMDTAVETGNLTKRQREYYEYYSKNLNNPMNLVWLDNMDEKLGIVSESLYNASSVGVDSWVTAWNNAKGIVIDDIEQTEEEIEAMIDAQDKLASNMVSIAGQMTSINEDYSKSLEDISNDETLTAEERIAATKKVEEAKLLATRSIILGYAQQILAQDGLTTEEAEALIQQGINWGIYSATAGEEMMKVISMASGVAGAINAMPSAKDITITTYHRDVYSGSSGVTGTGGGAGAGGVAQRELVKNKDLNGNGIIGAANGLDMIVPAGYQNDDFPIRAKTGERVEITPSVNKIDPVKQYPIDYDRLAQAISSSMSRYIR